MNKYDVIVIGGGPAGLAAASILAAHKRVIVFERDLWGGTCPNRGCDPKKMLYRAVEIKNAATQMKKAGVVGNLELNWPDLMAHKRAYTQTVPAGTLSGLHAANITTRHGQPRFIDAHTVELAGDRFSAADIIIASGRQPALPAIPGAQYLKTSADFLALEQLPHRIAFIGAGYVSLELANIAAAAGAQVHLVNRSEHALRGWDEQAVATVKETMQAHGVQWHAPVQLSEVAQATQGLRLVGADGFRLEVDMAVAAIGRVPAVDLNLEAAGLDCGPAGIAVDAHMRTAVPHIYAVGDVVAKPQPKLTPVATFEGRYVARHLLGLTEPIAYPAIPEILFGATELARVGVSVQDAKKAPERYAVLDQSVGGWYTYNRTQDRTARVVTITEKASGALVGALVVAAHAEELINQFTLLLGHPAQEARELIYAYPSASSDLQYLL